VRPLNLHDSDAFVALSGGATCVNHRQLGSPGVQSVADHMSSIRMTASLVPDCWVEPAEVLAQSAMGVVNHVVSKATSTDGVAVEIPFVGLILLDGDRVTSFEAFNADRRDLKNVDGRADQYALAATAFHLLTGTTLFQHSNPAVVISQHLSTPPPAIGTRRRALRNLGPVFSKALAKAPEDRYGVCVEFADALAKQPETVAAETGAAETTAAAIPVSRPRPQPWSPRAVSEPPKTHWKIVVAIIVALLLVATAIALIVLTAT